MKAFVGVEAIVWDLDETLIGSFDLFTGIIKDLADKFDLPMPSREAMLDNYHGSLEDTLRKTFNIYDEANDERHLR